MNIKRTLIILVMSILTVMGVAAQDKVAVLYNGNTAVNRETVGHLQEQAKESGRNYEFKSLKSGSSINPGEYCSVILLNTGRSSGIDPVILKNIESLQQDNALFLISLQQDRSDLTIEYSAPQPVSAEIDAVTAASKWKDKGLGSIFSGNNEYAEMHHTWTEYIFSRIDQLLEQNK